MRRARWIVLSGRGNQPVMRLVALVLVLAAPVFAQEAPSPPPLEEAPAPTDAPFVPSYQQPGFVYATPAPAVDRGGRVRWGTSFNLGWHLPYHAFGLGLEVHLGWQFSRVFSLYGTLGGHLGLGLGVDTGGNQTRVDARLIFHGITAAIAEVMLGDRFYLGAGPALAFGLFGMAGLSASRDEGTVTAVGAYGVKPGVDLRLGLGFGRGRAPGFRRGGFNIGIDALLLFHPNTVFTRVHGDGQGGTVEVRENGTMVTVTPMLTLGYEAR